MIELTTTENIPYKIIGQALDDFNKEINLSNDTYFIRYFTYDNKAYEMVIEFRDNKMKVKVELVWNYIQKKNNTNYIMETC